MYKKIITILSLLLIISVGIAKQYHDGDNIIVILAHNTGGDDRSSSISASIDGHCLTVVFLSNLGQVSIKILNEYGVTIDCMTTPTPNGYLCYITSAGHYTVVFTLPDGDEYYGEFDVTD